MSIAPNFQFFFGTPALLSLLFVSPAALLAQTAPVSLGASSHSAQFFPSTPRFTSLALLELPADPRAEPLPDSPGTVASATRTAAGPTESSSRDDPSAGDPIPDDAALDPSPQISGQGSQPSISSKQPMAQPSTAPSYDMTIAPGQTAPRQTVPDKVFGSVRDVASPFSLLGEVISAGYSHGVNGLPNYGTDGGAFAQRFGAAVARGSSQKLFYEGAMASILHEDARYYELGSKQNLFKRAIYAGTRPIIGRTDSGRATPNFALLTAYLGAAALTPVYYPEINHNGTDILRTYGGSLGGAALGDVVTEFLPDVLQFLHLKNVIHP